MHAQLGSPGQQGLTGREFYYDAAINQVNGDEQIAAH
jgi:hypothetical protein